MQSCCCVLQSLLLSVACGTQVLRCPKLDHLYAVSLLLSLPHNQARQLLVASRKLCKGYSKMMVRNGERGWEGRGREKRLRACIGYVESSLIFLIQAFSDLCIHLGTILGSNDMVSTASYFYRIAKWGKKLREYQVIESGLSACHGNGAMYILQFNQKRKENLS